jgi:hypothetical protein
MESRCGRHMASNASGDAGLRRQPQYQMVGKRRRGGEPVGRRDVQADQPGHSRSLKADARKDRRDQAESSNGLGNPLRLSRSNLRREIEQGQSDPA